MKRQHSHSAGHTPRTICGAEVEVGELCEHKATKDEEVGLGIVAAEGESVHWWCNSALMIVELHIFQGSAGDTSWFSKLRRE
jgi:hypothetical protein